MKEKEYGKTKRNKGSSFSVSFCWMFFFAATAIVGKVKGNDDISGRCVSADISVYMETADGKACGKDEVKAKISDTGVSLTVKSSDIFSDTDRGIYYHVLLDISTSIRADQFDAMKKSILALKKKIRKKTVYP